MTFFSTGVLLVTNVTTESTGSASIASQPNRTYIVSLSSSVIDRSCSCAPFVSSIQISCPAFTCNYSDCYTMYTTENATICTAAAYCQVGLANHNQ